MRNFNFDLHFHSNASDGEASVEALIETIGQATEPAQMYALADHDTLANSQTFMLGVENSLPAVELTARYGSASSPSAPHVLGYGVSWRNPDLASYMEERQWERVRRLRAWGARFAELGLRFETAELEALGQNFGKPHIVSELRRHRENEPFLPPPPEDETVSDPIYTKYLKVGGLADISKIVPSSLLTVPEVVEIIHAAGGVAILAHPQVSFYELGQDRRFVDWRAGVSKTRQALDSFVDAGLDGVEVFNYRHGPEFRAEILDWAQDKSLLITAGTDDHTSTGENIGRAFYDGEVEIFEPQAERWLGELLARLT